MSASDSGRAALVTGANRGLGLKTSRQLLDRSLRVVMTGRDERALQRATGTLGAGDRALALRMDDTDPARIEDFPDFNRAVRVYGHRV